MKTPPKSITRGSVGKLAVQLTEEDRQLIRDAVQSCRTAQGRFVSFREVSARMGANMSYITQAVSADPSGLSVDALDNLAWTLNRLGCVRHLLLKVRRLKRKALLHGGKK